MIARGGGEEFCSLLSPQLRVTDHALGPSPVPLEHPWRMESLSEGAGIAGGIAGPTAPLRRHQQAIKEKDYSEKSYVSHTQPKGNFGNN